MEMVKDFYACIGYITTTLFLIGLIPAILLWKNSFSVLYRLGKNLQKNKILIFAQHDNASSLETLLTGSGLYRKKNISHIASIEDLDRSEDYSLFLVHWFDWKDNILKILEKAPGSTDMIIFAPGDSKAVPKEITEKLKEKIHVSLVNYRGRLLNDVLITMMTKNA